MDLSVSTKYLRNGPGGRLRVLLGGMPRWLRAAFAIATLFAILVTLTGAAVDAKLVPLSERVSPTLGVNFAIPLVAAILAYLLGHLIMVLRGQRMARADFRRAVLMDAVVFLLFVWTLYFHLNLKLWLPLLNPTLHDELYYTVDLGLQPVVDLFVFLRAMAPASWPLFDQFYQHSLILMFVLTFGFLAPGRHSHFAHVVIAILLTMALGGFGYAVAPAVGPFLFEKGSNSVATLSQADMWAARQQLLAGGREWLTSTGPQYFTGGLAAMPSLHIAHAAVMTWYAHKSGHAARWLFLALSLFIVIESVATRWHYLVDIPAGAVVALVVILLTNRICDGAARNSAQALENSQR